MPLLLLLAGLYDIVSELMKPQGKGPTLADKQAFIARMRVIARRIESQGAVDSYTGAAIPPGIKADFGIAQLAMESAYGTSELAVQAFNLAGITADPDSTTYWVTRRFPVYRIVTTERKPDGTEYRKTRSFRRYSSLEESYIDWGRLLYSMYPEAFAAAQVGDFRAFAEGLQQRSYALNDRQYASKVQNFGAEIARIA